MGVFKVNNIFITGGNRGIGLGLVKAMLEQFKPQHLFATYRTPSNSQELLELSAHNKNLHPVQFDVVEYDKLPGVVEEVDRVTGGTGINLLINNSGILGRECNGIRDVTRDDLIQHFETNTIAPVMITQVSKRWQSGIEVKAFLPLLEKAASASHPDQTAIQKAAIINVSTLMASISDNTSGGVISYRTTKSALNMASKCISFDLKGTGITTVLIHPGWVQTDMGTSRAPVTVDESVTKIITTLKGLKDDANGKFVRFQDGAEIPW